MCVIREQGLLQFYQAVDKHETRGLPGGSNQELRLPRKMLFLVDAGRAVSYLFNRRDYWHDQ